VNPLHGPALFRKCRTICNLTSSRKYVKRFTKHFSELSTPLWKLWETQAGLGFKVTHLTGSALLAPSGVPFGHIPVKQPEGTTGCIFEAALRHFPVFILLARFEK
jgi:hypothetical protein